MKSSLKKIFTLCLWVISTYSFSQISINTDNSDPDPSAMLDIKSTNKGILVPRLTTAQRTAVSNPATGLLVYDNSTNSFWFYSGTAWAELTSGTVPIIPNSIADADNTTKIQVEETPGDEKVRIDLNGSERMVIERNSGGNTLLSLPNNNGNVFLGEGTGINTSNTADENTYIGYQAAFHNTANSKGTYIGYQTGFNNTSSNNTFIGYRAGFNSSTDQNTFVGLESGYSNTGSQNLFIGNYAGRNSSGGSFNTYLGNGAGQFSSGSNNVFVGLAAGTNETGSNKLYIENSSSSTPLIYGEFDNDLVKIHGTLGIGNTYTFPTIAGTAEQFLQTDGAGNTAWASPPASTDDQKADVFNLNGTTLELSLENDGEATKMVDLSSINADDQKADVFNLNGTTLELSLENDGEATKTVDLSSINADDQKADVFNLNGTTLELSLENDGEATKMVDLSSINATKSLIADADNNTKIQVEESADEDIIRFDIANTEVGYFNKNSNNDLLIYTTTGNVMLGHGVGANNTGDSNVFIGKDVGRINTSGRRNTFIGNQAAFQNTTGELNTFIGTIAGRDNVTGSRNVFIGDSAGSESGGNGNTYIGVAAGAVSGGNDNVFMGDSAGANNTAGNNNVVIGTAAGLSSAGSGNIFIGYFSGASESGSNKLHIENSNSSTPLIYGEFDNDKITVNGQLTTTGITFPNAGIYFPNAFSPDPTYIGTAGNFLAFAHSGTSEDFLGYKTNAFYFADSQGGADTAHPDVYANDFKNYSSRRWKHNIQHLDNAISIIQKLRGVTYTWNEDHGGRDDFGFIAEEVNEILPEIAPKGKDGQVDGVSYGKLTPYLVEAIKEQQKIIEELERKVQRIDALEAMLKEMQSQQSISVDQN